MAAKSLDLSSLQTDMNFNPNSLYSRSFLAMIACSTAKLALSISNWIDATGLVIIYYMQRKLIFIEECNNFLQEFNFS